MGGQKGRQLGGTCAARFATHDLWLPIYAFDSSPSSTYCACPGPALDLDTSTICSAQSAVAVSSPAPSIRTLAAVRAVAFKQRGSTGHPWLRIGWEKFTRSAHARVRGIAWRSPQRHTSAPPWRRHLSYPFVQSYRVERPNPRAFAALRGASAALNPRRPRLCARAMHPMGCCRAPRVAQGALLRGAPCREASQPLYTRGSCSPLELPSRGAGDGAESRGRCGASHHAVRAVSIPRPHAKCDVSGFRGLPCVPVA